MLANIIHTKYGVIKIPDILFCFQEYPKIWKAINKIIKIIYKAFFLFRKQPYTKTHNTNKIVLITIITSIIVILELSLRNITHTKPNII